MYFLVFIVLFSLCNTRTPLGTEERKEFIKNLNEKYENGTSLWKARNSFTGERTLATGLFVEESVGANGKKDRVHQTKDYRDLDNKLPLPNYKTPVDKLPKHFDARKQWPYCKSIKLVRDQGPCGGCWANSAAAIYSDRYCILTKGKHQPIISYRNLLSCAKHSRGCHGGYVDSAANYMADVGAITGGLHKDQDTCQPDIFKECNHHETGSWDLCKPAHNTKTPQCLDYCDGKNSTQEAMNEPYYAKGYYSVFGADRLKQDIYHYGPIAITFHVNEDFYFYDTGIYHKSLGGDIGWHAVRAIGWGEDDQGNEYWLLSNSWNSEWGENGFVRVKRGSQKLESSFHIGITPKIRETDINSLVEKELSKHNEFMVEKDDQETNLGFTVKMISKSATSKMATTRKTVQDELAQIVIGKEVEIYNFSDIFKIKDLRERPMLILFLLSLISLPGIYCIYQNLNPKKETEIELLHHRSSNVRNFEALSYYDDHDPADDYDQYTE